MVKEKIPKQKPHTSFNRRQSVVKNPEVEHDNGQEKCLKFYFTRGEHDKGGIWQRVLRYMINKKQKVKVDEEIKDDSDYGKS